MNYITINGQDAAESAQRAAEINNLLYQVTRIEDPRPEDVTNKVFAEVTSVATGMVALEIDLTYKLRMHNVLKAQMLVTVLSGTLPQQELDDKLAYIAANQGEAVQFQDLLPPSEPVFTFSELEAEGWWSPTEDDD